MGLTEEASEPQPTISCPECYPLPKRPQVLPRQMLVWLQVKAGVAPSRTQLYTHPQLEGSGVLSPRPWGQLLPLAPCPSVPHSWPLTSSLLLGSQGSSSHASFPWTVSRAACPWPPGGVPGSQAGLATKQLCLTGLCWLCSACTAGLGGAGPGAGRGFLRDCSQPASSCGGGRRLPQGHALQVGTQARPSSGGLQQPHLNSQLLCGAFTCRRRKL